MPVPGLTEIATVACLFFIFLVPLAGAGLALINAGLGRSRSAAHIMMASLSALSVAGLVYFVCGFAWQGFIGRPGSHPHSFGQGMELDRRGAILLSRAGAGRFSLPLWPRCCKFSASGLAALIPLGSGADRWRLRASCLSTALLAGWTYPLFAHWVWGGGWLAQLGANYGLGHGFLDVGGASSIHVLGGLYGPGRHLDSRPAAREIFRGRHGARDPRPQCSSCVVRLPAGLARMVGAQFRRRDPVYRRRTVRWPC